MKPWNENNCRILRSYRVVIRCLMCLCSTTSSLQLFDIRPTAKHNGAFFCTVSDYRTCALAGYRATVGQWLRALNEVLRRLSTALRSRWPRAFWRNFFHAWLYHKMFHEDYLSIIDLFTALAGKEMQSAVSVHPFLCCHSSFRINWLTLIFVCAFIARRRLKMKVIGKCQGLGLELGW